jgi:hypothetical protein
MEFCVILEYIVTYVYDVSFWYICVHIFYVGKSISKLQIDVGYYMFEWGTWGYSH